MKLNGVRQRLPFRYDFDFRDITGDTVISDPDGHRRTITMKNGDVFEWGDEWGLDGIAYSHFCMWLNGCYRKDRWAKSIGFPSTS